MTFLQDSKQISPAGLQNAGTWESISSVLKNEQIYHGRYATRQEAVQGITEYIEIFYNRQRRQARLGFLSPPAFERWLYEKCLAA